MINFTLSINRNKQRLIHRSVSNFLQLMESLFVQWRVLLSSKHYYLHFPSCTLFFPSPLFSFSRSFSFSFFFSLSLSLSFFLLLLVSICKALITISSTDKNLPIVKYTSFHQTVSNTKLRLVELVNFDFHVIESQSKIAHFSRYDFHDRDFIVYVAFYRLQYRDPRFISHRFWLILRVDTSYCKKMYCSEDISLHLHEKMIMKILINPLISNFTRLSRSRSFSVVKNWS